MVYCSIKETIDKEFLLLMLPNVRGKCYMGIMKLVALKNMGVISGKDINYRSCIGKLMYMLGQGISQELQNHFRNSLRGEMSLKFQPKIFLQLFFLLFAALSNFREVAEWSKAHAWKACIRQKRIEGSNPFLSAKLFFGV